MIHVSMTQQKRRDIMDIISAFLLVSQGGAKNGGNHKFVKNQNRLLFKKKKKFLNHKFFFFFYPTDLSQWFERFNLFKQWFNVSDLFTHTKCFSLHYVAQINLTFLPWSKQNLQHLLAGENPYSLSLCPTQWSWTPYLVHSNSVERHLRFSHRKCTTVCMR